MAMEGSDSEEEESRAIARKPPADAGGEAGAGGDVPAAEGAVIAESADRGTEVPEATKVAKQEEGVPEPQPASSSSKPSYTLRIRGLPSDLDMSELEMRLSRFGEVVSLQEEDGLVVAKFSRTNDAYKAREKLNGSSPYGAILQVDFGPQDAEHYNRGKKRAQGRGRREFLDGSSAAVDMAAKGTGGPAKGGRGMRAWQDAPSEVGAPGGTAPKGTEGDVEEPGGASKKRKLADEGKALKATEAAAPDAKSRAPAAALVPPSKPVSRWSREISFEEQLEDFMKMPRRGMYNRYLVLGKLPPELRTGEAIWRMMHPVQRDIIQIEMLTCFGKPVAHIALRSATAAAAMHRLCEQMHQNLTVAFAPPRRASATLWLGNVDDFVPRKELEILLSEYGKVVNGLRYLPARTCAFASFTEVNDAVVARNTLYGLEVQRNQYLNVDFVDEGDQGFGADGWGVWPSTPWAQPAWGGPWAGAARPWAPTPWGITPQGAWRGDQRKRGEEQWRDGRAVQPAPWGAPPPPRGAEPARPLDRSKREHRHRSRTRSHGRRSEASAQAGRPRKRHKQEQSPAPRPAKQAARSDSEEQPPRPPPGIAKGEAKAGGKAKVKLYKMGEFCCNIVANYVKGKETADPLQTKLHIDQRTKIGHCRSHMERAGPLATVWHYSAADRRDCAAYDALCDYFVEKQRVGLVQTPSYYVYIVPPTEKYLKELSLPTSNFVVGLQIPIKK